MKLSSLWTLALAAMLVFCPALLEACPRCFEASPYRTGLIWAALFLLPVPFVLATLIFLWARNATKPKFPNF